MVCIDLKSSVGRLNKNEFVSPIIDNILTIEVPETETIVHDCIRVTSGDPLKIGFAPMSPILESSPASKNVPEIPLGFSKVSFKNVNILIFEC